MNFFGKRIDPKTLETIEQILKTPEGQKLKQEMEKMDKKSMVEQMKKLNLSQKELDEATGKLNNINAEDILKKIKNGKKG